MADIQELLNEVQAGTVPPATVIVGDEPFLRQQAVDALRAAVTGGDAGGFNEDVFHGKGLRAEAVISALRTLPMLAARRFVLVRDVAAMATAEADQLAPYLLEPIPDACLVLVAEKLDGRSRLAKAGKKAGLVVDAKALRGAALNRFAKARAKVRGRRLTEPASAALVDAVGSDLSALDDAIERLSLFVCDSVIDVEDVDRCVARVRSESIWALVDAVADRRRAEALLAAASLLRDREAPLRILALIARQLRLVARTKAGLDAGLSPSEAVKRAGAPPFKARELAGSARKFRQPDLQRAFRLVAEADLELKGSRRDGGAILEEAILRLCRPTVADRARYDGLVSQRRKLFRAGA